MSEPRPPHDLSQQTVPEPSPRKRRSLRAALTVLAAGLTVVVRLITLAAVLDGHDDPAPHL